MTTPNREQDPAAGDIVDAAAAPDGQDPVEEPTTAPLSATQEGMLNEDWTKVAEWDVTGADGETVATLDALVEVLGVEDRQAAATELLGSPAAVSAPAELLEEARAEVNPDPAQASLFDELVADDEEAGLPPAGGIDDDEAPEADPEAEEPEEDDKPFPGAKAFPWAKDKDKGPDTGSSTRKETIAAGAFVSGPFGKGKVEVVVTNGKVPGIDTDVEGTKDAPAARIRVYEESDGDWKATDKKVGAKVKGLKTIPPLGAAKFGKKSGAAGLVLLVADAKRLPADQQPDATAIRTVYQRGLNAWPGESKTLLSAEDWALQRAQAFVDLAQGVGTEGYVGDNDLLP